MLKDVIYLVTVVVYRDAGSNAYYVEHRRHLSELAMSCINELLTKNCVPHEYEEFVLAMFGQMFTLLQGLTKAHRIEELSEVYEIETFLRSCVVL